MAKIVRIPITNVYADGDYTGRIFVGAAKTPVNVQLDTGSSAFALDGNKFHPQLKRGDKPTHLAQYSDYGDHSGWTGAVLKMNVAIGRARHQVSLSDAHVAVSTRCSRGMFGATDGILGLAYKALDDAYEKPENTWPAKYSRSAVMRGRRRLIFPYLIQLAHNGVVSDIFAFYTKRSQVHHGAGDPKRDPLNKGWLVVGGGEQCREFYRGRFQVAKVFTREYYNTRIKTIAVGDGRPIRVRKRAPAGDYTNSIVDSGTNSIDFDPVVLDKVLAEFCPAQRRVLLDGIKGNIAPSRIGDLKAWPDLVFVLEGPRKDVILRVRARDYWQLNATPGGKATAAITRGSKGQTILGLPLMNGYFTVFDGEAARGMGVVKFAERRG